MGFKPTEIQKVQSEEKAAASRTDFLAMQGIAKRVQDLLNSEAPITHSTVWFRANQLRMVATKLSFFPATHSLPPLRIAFQHQKTLAKLG